MPPKKSSSSPKKIKFLFIKGMVLTIAAAVALGVTVFNPQTDSQPGITEQIQSYSGYTQFIDQKEYEFFEYLAARDIDDKTDAESLARRTKELAQTAHAQFYLANRLDLYGPYSFENLQTQMKHENARRKISKENGQAIYGPETFDIYRYYQYVSSNLKVDIIDYLASHADDALESKAREYFRQNQHKYNLLEQIEYVLEENGRKEEVTLNLNQLNSLENADSQLAEFLREGSQNEEFTYLFGKTERVVKILSVTYNKVDFDEQKTTIIQHFLNSGYYEELLEEVGRNNPIELNLT